MASPSRSGSNRRAGGMCSTLLACSRASQAAMSRQGGRSSRRVVGTRSGGCSSTSASSGRCSVTSLSGSTSRSIRATNCGRSCRSSWPRTGSRSLSTALAKATSPSSGCRRRPPRLRLRASGPARSLIERTERTSRPGLAYHRQGALHVVGGGTERGSDLHRGSCRHGLQRPRCVLHT